MKFLGAIFWMTLFTTIAGAVLGGVYGAVFALISVIFDQDLGLFFSLLLLSVTVGGLIGVNAGAALGTFLGVVIAISLIGQELPIDETVARRFLVTGGLAAVVAGLVMIPIYYANTQEFQPLTDLFIFFVPAAIAIGASVYVTRLYSRRLMRVKVEVPASE